MGAEIILYIAGHSAIMCEDCWSRVVEAGEKMRPIWVVDVLGLLLFIVAQPATAAVIVNPSFETPVVTHSSKFIYLYAGDPTITGWTINGISVDLNGAIWQAQDGTQTVDLSGTGPGGIYQDIATVPGQIYRLSFWMAGNPGLNNGLPSGGAGVKTAKVSFGGVVLGTPTFDSTGHTFADMQYVLEQFQVTATSSLSRLEFDSLNGDQYGPVIDNVSLVEIPEPATVGSGVAVVLIWATRRGKTARHGRRVESGDFDGKCEVVR